jgi:hypothetical protein
MQTTSLKLKFCHSDPKPRVNKQGWRRRFPPKFYLVKKLSTVTVSSASSIEKVSAGPKRVIQHQHADGEAAMVDVAAAELDQVNRRFIGRELADLYYGLLCWC